MYVHSYETRGREDCRTGRRKTVAFQRFPSKASVQFVNNLLNLVTSAILPKVFKTRLTSALITEDFYCIDEFMAQLGDLIGLTYVGLLARLGNFGIYEKLINGNKIVVLI